LWLVNVNFRSFPALPLRYDINTNKTISAVHTISVSLKLFHCSAQIQTDDPSNLHTWWSHLLKICITLKPRLKYYWNFLEWIAFCPDWYGSDVAILKLQTMVSSLLHLFCMFDKNLCKFLLPKFFMFEEIPSSLYNSKYICRFYHENSFMFWVSIYEAFKFTQLVWIWYICCFMSWICTISHSNCLRIQFRFLKFNSQKPV
jgi:hypothetical protein